MNYRIVFNLAVCILATFVLLVLIGVNIFSNIEKRKTFYYFLWSLVSVTIVMVIDIVSYSLRLNNNNNVDPLVFKILDAILHISTHAASYAFLLYCLSFSKMPFKKCMITSVISGIIGILSSITLIVNIFTGFLHTFEYVDGTLTMIKSNYAFLVFTYLWINFLIETIIIIIIKDIKVSERIAYLLFVLLPASALVFHVIYPGYSIFTFAIIASFLAHFIYFYVQRGLTIQKQEKELSEKQIELTISQIRPHFIYNCLSSISYLCTKDPEQAVEAIDDFSSFLRVNFSNISQNKIVPFSQELEHTMKYVKLEKMRFEDRVRVYFDIRVDSFQIPSLTLQPLVENAVKHGICKRAEGGTIVIKTSETDKEYLVEVTDDGVGFDPNIPPADGRVHVGLANVEKRLKSMVKGRLEIYSKINKGTKMTIHIPK